MKKEEISKYNLLIAKFMGGKFTLIKSHTPNVSFKEHPRQDRNHNSTDMHPKFLSYHKSWDWLMPVAKKIVNLPDAEKESEGWYAKGNIETFLCMVDIEKVYEYVIKYIEWYNSKKN